MSRRGSIYRKKGRINEQFVAVRHSMLKGPLIDKGYLKPIDIFFYCMIRSKETGDPELDKKLKFTNAEAKNFASVSTFSQSKFRLWAFRCLEVTRWGRKTKQQPKEEQMDYLEFIARVTSHIPDKGQVMIRYYGLYSNAHRGKKRKAEVDPSHPPIIDEKVLSPRPSLPF